jgi:tRNA pseudouridine13 synthase
MPDRTPTLPDWQRAFGEPCLCGDLRSDPRDFIVVEELGFEPDGEGEHDYLWLEKTASNTAWVAEQLAAFAGIPVRDVGYAGMKDRHAVTRQWFSVRRPRGAPAEWTGLRIDGLTVLRVSRNRRKLRRGAHRGNRFHIVLRNTEPLSGDPGARLADLARLGVPNYFAEQRFGRDAGNLQLASRLFAGARLPRQRRGLALSAARSLLFNAVLERRVRLGTWNQLLPGDCANLDGSGSVFPVDCVDDDLRLRASELDLHATGPLWGRGALLTTGDVASLEQEVAAVMALESAGLEKHGLEQARRALRLSVRELEWSMEGRTLELDFRLTRGAFATAVLRELATVDDLMAQ